MPFRYCLTLAIALAAVAAVGGAASAADDLYRTQAIVTGQGEAERARGFALCLEAVLVKASGDPRLIGDPEVVPMKAQAGSFVIGFEYQDRMKGIPVHDEQGTRDRPYDLTVTFDQQKIDAALRSLRRTPWLASLVAGTGAPLAHKRRLVRRCLPRRLRPSGGGPAGVMGRSSALNAA